jgi:Ni,Fe-hydrogenase I large subunit
MQSYSQPIYQQPNQIEQAGQLLDLLNKLDQRRGSSNPEPGQTGTQFNAAQFQSNPQLLQMQELLLRNPQLLSQLQQPQQQVEQTQQQQSQSTQQQLEQLTRENRLLKYTAQQTASYNQNLSAHAQVAGLSHIAMNGLTEQLSHAVDMATIGGAALHILQPALNQMAAQEDMINVMQKMLTDPWFLLHHCFEVWFATVTPDNSGFVDLLSEAYMKFIEAFEISHKQSFGRYSDTYTEYLSAQANQIPTELQQKQQAVANIYQDFARQMQQPGFGSKMQQQHSIMRQMVGMR